MTYRYFLTVVFGLTVGLLPGASAMALSYQHAPGYAPSTWSSVHADAGNTKYVPLALTPNIKRKWHLLKGAGIWSAPTIGADGTLYFTSGRGRGFPHLHAIASNGAIRWQSGVYKNDDDLDTLAILSAPLIDDKGDIYLGDSNQLWAYRPDGAVKWVTDLAKAGVGGPIATAVLAGRAGQYVGGVSAWGRVGLFHRDSGRLAMPVLDLPGTANAAGSGIPKGLWSGGLVAEDSRESVWEILQGERYEVCTTPAVDRNTGRIFVSAGGRDQNHGLLYGIDVGVDALTIAFETRIPAGHATSPALSPDGTMVYGMAGDGLLYAIDANTGRTLWNLPLNANNATPSVGPGNRVYVPADNKLVAIDGDQGKVLWRRGYSAFAGDRMPTIKERSSVIREYGRPDSFIDSVVTVTEGRLWTTFRIGYHVEVGDEKRIHSASSFLVSVNPLDGEMLDSWPIPDTNDGGISISSTGDIYVGLLAANASQAWGGGYDKRIPKNIRVRKPQGGLLAFAPVSQLQQLQVGFNRVRRHVQKPWSVHQLNQARAQLWAMQRSGDLAARAREISKQQLMELLRFLYAFDAALGNCISDSKCAEAEGLTGQLTEQLKALRN